MNEAYRGWYKYIEDDANNEVIEVEAEVEIKIGGWDTQQPENLLYLIRELEFDKYHDQALDSLIDFSLYIL